MILKLIMVRLGWQDLIAHKPGFLGVASGTSLSSMALDFFQHVRL